MRGRKREKREFQPCGGLSSSSLESEVCQTIGRSKTISRADTYLGAAPVQSSRGSGGSRRDGKESPGIPKTPHLTAPRLVPPCCNDGDGDKSGAATGAESHALVNRVAGPFMSSARSSLARSCVHAGKVFFSVCFTGGQGYRGGKRETWQGAKEMGEVKEEEEEGVGRVLRATTTSSLRYSYALSFFFLCLFLCASGVSLRIEINSE